MWRNVFPGGGLASMRLRGQGLLVLVLAFLCFVKWNCGSIHIYEEEPFREVGNAYLLAGGSEGIRASRSVREGRSFIRFVNVTFWRKKDVVELLDDGQQGSELVQIVVFETEDRNNIGGSAYGGQRSLCCTADLAKIEGCKQGEVLRIPSLGNPNWPFLLKVQFNGNQLSATVENEEIAISKTGMYNLFFIACNPNLKGLVMSGKTIWRNPEGFLPGRMSPLMKFYGFMSLTYLILCVMWLAQYWRFWEDVLQLQHCITTVIALGLLEMVLWYAEYSNYNFTGVRPVAITFCVVSVGAVRKTVSRILVLVVSMGYGVMRPTLGGLSLKVLLIGVTYFLASDLLDITEYVGIINDLSGRATMALVLPAALLDAFLILWIFTSLSTTLEELQVKKSLVKLEIYRKFSNALVVTVIASIIWICYEVYFKATDPFNEHWRSAWIITGFWDLLSFALLCGISYLWAPSHSSQRYAYSKEVELAHDEAESQPLAAQPKDQTVEA